ncbi:MAG: glutathione S-transferase family protein [Burkholderiales bacterium]|nr:glutathione S-transferase family protein [Burkholderiales bacterium]
MKLYGFPLSPNTRKVLAVVHALDLDVELVVVDLVKGEQMKPEFIRLNPNHKTPTLQDGDFVLWESNAIMQYLASQKPGNTLWPADPKAQADISRWQCWQLAHWGAACEMLIFENMLKALLSLGEPDPAEVAKGEERFNIYATVLDGYLKGRKWLVGNQVTLADLSVGSYLMYAEAARFPWKPYDEIRRWYTGLEQVEAWKASAPPAMA